LLFWRESDLNLIRLFELDDSIIYQTIPILEHQHFENATITQTNVLKIYRTISVPPQLV